MEICTQPKAANSPCNETKNSNNCNLSLQTVHICCFLVKYFSPCCPTVWFHFHQSHIPCASESIPQLHLLSPMITVVGSLNYDLVTYTDKVPDAGETFQANTFENHLGGKGLNESLACARLSKDSATKVRTVGNVGADTFGKELKQALVDAGIDTQYVATLEGYSSGVAVILVETSGENRILYTPGANGQLKLTNEQYETYFADSSDGDFVVVQNEYPDTVKTIEWVKKHRPGVNIALNPSPFKPISPETLAKIDLLIVNEGEALEVGSQVFSGSDLDAFKATIASDETKGFGHLAEKLQTLLDQNNVSSVIITMGSKGSISTSKDAAEPVFTPSKKVTNVVDTTGAGDTFFGGVVLRLSGGATLSQAVEFATRASALAIQKKGAAEGIPTYKMVEEATF